MADTQYGLLVDYTYFSGNHAAEIACKEELGLPLEQFGIKEVEVGPFRKGEGDTGDAWEWFYIPCPTSIFSEHWGAGGDKYYGPLDEMYAKMQEFDRPTVLFRL